MVMWLPWIEVYN